jgi:hypothetical protein
MHTYVLAQATPQRWGLVAIAPSSYPWKRREEREAGGGLSLMDPLHRAAIAHYIPNPHDLQKKKVNYGKFDTCPK